MGSNPQRIKRTPWKRLGGCSDSKSSNIELNPNFKILEVKTQENGNIDTSSIYVYVCLFWGFGELYLQICKRVGGDWIDLFIFWVFFEFRVWNKGGIFHFCFFHGRELSNFEVVPRGNVKDASPFFIHNIG